MQNIRNRSATDYSLPFYKSQLPQEVMFSPVLVSQLASLFVSKQDYAITTRLIFTKFDGKVAHGPRRKRSDFGGNLDPVSDQGIF